MATMSHNQEWQSSLCDCSPCDSCLLSTFLPCILFGRTSQRMRNAPNVPVESTNSECMIFCGIQSFTGCGWIYNMMRRGEIREKYGIEGGGMGDCCTSFWCLCCAMVQQDNEVRARQAQGCNNQGYQPVKEDMRMP